MDFEEVLHQLMQQLAFQPQHHLHHHHLNLVHLKHHHHLVRFQLLLHLLLHLIRYHLMILHHLQIRLLHEYILVVLLGLLGCLELNHLLPHFHLNAQLLLVLFFLCPPIHLFLVLEQPHLYLFILIFHRVFQLQQLVP